MVNGHYYKLGYGWCAKCGTYVKHRNFRCPMCHAPVRLNPKHSKFKRQLKYIDPERYGVRVDG